MIFARWSPLRCFGAALLFGGAGAWARRCNRSASAGGITCSTLCPTSDAGDPRADLQPGSVAAGAPANCLPHVELSTHERLCHDDRRFVAADPYPWPYNGELRPANTALIVIDMQTDFCGKGGYVDKMGYDLSLTRADRADRARAGAAAAAGLSHDPHARRPSPRSVRPAGQQALAFAADRRRGIGIGDAGPCGRILVRGEPGWEIIPALAPLPGEVIIDKPGKGSFYATDLELDAAHARHRQPDSRPASPPTSVCTRPCAMPTTVASSACCCRIARPRPTTATTWRRSRWSPCKAACSARMRRQAPCWRRYRR